MESSVQGVDHVIWTGLNVEIGVEYRKILVVVFLNVYLFQLIKHSILRILNILFVYFLSIFSDKSFKLIPKYDQKMPI